MVSLKKLFIIPFGVFVVGNVSHASILDAVVMNVVGQVSNAVGSRLGDEIYYGSSRGVTQQRRHKKRKKRRVIPQDTPEMQIQKALASLGFYRGKIDGLINSYETRSAIKAMNIAYNLGSTSSLAPETKDSLIYLGTLFGFDRCLISQKNDKRTKGRKIQTSLKIHGFYFTRIDGAVGKGTRRCIADYKMSKGLSHGSSLDFEEEYQLINTAKQVNDKNIDGTINALQNTHSKRMAMPQGQTGQYSQAVNSSYVPQGQMQAPQYNQAYNNMPQRQMQASQYPQQATTMSQGQMQASQYPQQATTMNQRQMQGSQYPQQATTMNQRQMQVAPSSQGGVQSAMPQGQVQTQYRQQTATTIPIEETQALQPTNQELIPSDSQRQINTEATTDNVVAAVPPAMYTAE